MLARRASGCRRCSVVVDSAFPWKGGGRDEADPHLFSPLQIGTVTVRNRIMQTAHVKLWAHNAVDSRTQRRLPGRSREGRRRSPDHRQPGRPPDLDHGLPARRLGVPAGSARVRPAADVCRPRARRAHLRAAEPLRPQRDERLRGRPPRSLGPVGGEVAGLRRDAEGDGARGHPRGGRVVGALRRAHARGRLRRHGGAHLAQLPPASVPVAALQQARRTSTAGRSRTGSASRAR